MAERGTPEHTLRMLNDENYPTAYERAMLCEVQPEPYMVRQIENLLAMLDYARKERSENQAIQQERDWADKVLDEWGAPRTVHNPYDHEDQPLNLPGRIAFLVDPKNEGWRASELAVLQQRIEGALRYLDKCQRDGHEIGGRPLRNLLFPTQETDPE